MIVRPEHTLQDLGLSPIEGQSIQAPYANYWTETYLPAVENIVMLDEQAVSKLHQASNTVVGYIDVIMGKQDIISTIPVQRTSSAANPAVGIKQAKNETVYAITQWDEMTGSLNVMTDGQGHMLRGAAMLQQENLKHNDEMFIPVDLDAYKTDYKAFMAQRRKNDLSSQKPNGTLLKCGELVHKAAWIEQEDNRRRHLFDAATEIYRYLNDSPVTEPPVRRHAQNYLSDIVFHDLSEQIRTARVKGDETLLHTAQDQMEQQIVEDARALHESYRNLFPLNEKARRGVAGTLFEDIAPLAIRNAIFTEGLENCEVRHAFSSEDKGVHGVRPKPGFDIVGQTFTPEGVTATPVQLKYTDTGRRSVESNYVDKSETYLPGLPFFHEKQISTPQILLATRELGGIATNSGREHERRLAPLRDLGERLGSLLMAS